MGTYRDHGLERMKTIMDRIPVLRAKAVGLPATLTLAALMAFAGGAPAAEPYPDRPITLIVPYAAGGSSDVLARLIGERMSKSLGQQVVIDNRAGAGSRLGIEIAAKSAADGSRSRRPTRKKSPSPRAESEVPPTSRRSSFRPKPASSSCMCRFAAPARP
jgi:hypothetical protein